MQPPAGLMTLTALALFAASVAGCSFISVATPTPVASPCVPQLRAEYHATATSDRAVTADEMASARTIIEHRLNDTGATGVAVRVEGNDRLVVQLAATTDPAFISDVRRLIAQPGRLEFIPVPAGRIDVEAGQTIPPDLLTDPGPLFGGEELSEVQSTLDQANRPAIEFQLKPGAAQVFANYTATHVGEQFAIVLDGVVQAAPSISSPITEGDGIISGDFTKTDVAELVSILMNGALPVQLHEVAFGPAANCAA
jgi:protein-export membrane protein SecD